MAGVEKKIIQFLSDYPERDFYSQEIANKIKCSKASASNILKSLSEKKMIFKKTKGHMRFYQINPKNPNVKKFKISAILERINPILPRLEKVSKKIILFGSGSRGEQTFNSDIDLFILASDKKETYATLKKLNYALNIKAIAKTFSEWSEMENQEPELYQEIKNGITLYDYVPRI